MTIALKYIGLQNAGAPFAELSVTGKQRDWTSGQVQDCSDADAILLFATGQFEPAWKRSLSDDGTRGLLRQFNVIFYGAKCDGRVVADGTMTARTGAGTVTIGSATANFSQADVGKRFGINPIAPTVGYTITRGYIVSVESPTSCTAQVGATVAAIASAGSLCIATDDSAAVVLALAAASVSGGEIFFPGLSAVTIGNILLPAGVSMAGVGDGYRSIQRFNANGSGIVYLGDFSSTGYLVGFGGLSCGVRNMVIDAAGAWPFALDFQQGGNGNRVVDSTICRANTTTMRTSGSAFVRGCNIHGGWRGQPLEVAGDSQVIGNYVNGAGDNQFLVFCNNPTDDFQLVGNHLWRNGFSLNTPSNPGGHLQISAFSTAAAAGGVVKGNTFDTCEGHSIQLDIFTTTAGRPGIQALAISENQFYQPQGMTTDTYACIRVNCGSNVANLAILRALSVMGNVVKGSPGTAQGQASGTTARWKAFIEWNMQASNVSAKAVSVVGNTMTDCKQLYSTVGAAYSPDYSAGNANFDGTTVTVG